MLPYFLVILGAAATVTADWFSKSWSQNRQWEYFAMAGLLYLLTGISFTLSLTMGKLTVLNAFWSVFVLIASTLLGIFIFHESINAFQKTGLILGFFSILSFALAEVIE